MPNIERRPKYTKTSKIIEAVGEVAAREFGVEKFDPDVPTVSDVSVSLNNGSHLDQQVDEVSRSPEAPGGSKQ